MSPTRAILLDALDQGAEGLRASSSEVSEHLAVDLDPGLLESMDELRIAQPMLPGRCVDAHDPKAPKLTLALSPIVEGAHRSVEQSLTGFTWALRAKTPEALGQFEDLLVPAPSDDPSLSSWHQRSPSRSRSRRASHSGRAKLRPLFRIELPDLCQLRWRFPGCLAITLPVALSLSRSLALLWVLTLGIPSLHLPKRPMGL
jgi:hypothetical protein